MTSFLLGSLAAIAFALPAHAATLVYQASFTAEYTSFNIHALTVYDSETREIVDNVSAEELGLVSPIADSWSASISVYALVPEPEDPFYDYRLNFIGTPLNNTSTAFYRFVSINYESQTAWGGFGSYSFGVGFHLGPEGGSLDYVDDSHNSGCNEDFCWSQPSAAGRSYSLAFSDVHISVPAAVSLPPGGLLLSGALALLAIRRKKRPAPG